MKSEPIVLKEESQESKEIMKEWFTEAKEMTLEKLPEFLRKLTEDYVQDYGTIVSAMVAGALGTVWAINKSGQGGITGFQAGFVPLYFYREWSDIKGPFKVVKFEDMIYPQYEEKFARVMEVETFKGIYELTVKTIQKHIFDSKDGGVFVIPTHPDVCRHWLSILDGFVPFGWKCKQNGKDGLNVEFITGFDPVERDWIDSDVYADLRGELLKMWWKFTIKVK